MPKIYLPSRLRTCTHNQRWIEIEGSTLQELLQNLTQNFPELSPLLFQDGNLNSYTRVFLNNKESFDFTLPIMQNDEIHIIQAMAGG